MDTVGLGLAATVVVPEVAVPRVRVLGFGCVVEVVLLSNVGAPVLIGPTFAFFCNISLFPFICISSIFRFTDVFIFADTVGADFVAMGALAASFFFADFCSISTCFFSSCSACFKSFSARFRTSAVSAFRLITLVTFVSFELSKSRVRKLMQMSNYKVALISAVSHLTHLKIGLYCIPEATPLSKGRLD